MQSTNHRESTPPHSMCISTIQRFAVSESTQPIDIRELTPPHEMCRSITPWTFKLILKQDEGISVISVQWQDYCKLPNYHRAQGFECCLTPKEKSTNSDYARFYKRNGVLINIGREIEANECQNIVMEQSVKLKILNAENGQDLYRLLQETSPCFVAMTIIDGQYVIAIEVHQFDDKNKSIEVTLKKVKRPWGFCGCEGFW